VRLYPIDALFWNGYNLRNRYLETSQLAATTPVTSTHSIASGGSMKSGAFIRSITAQNESGF